MSIAVPDRCILAESNQLIKYSSPSNSQTEALKQKANTLGLSVKTVMQHKLVGHFWWEWPVKQKNKKKRFILQGLLHPRALDGVL